jgi:uncharacterized protein
VKVLAFTDPHGDTEDAKVLVDLIRREHPDMIVCAGDFSLFGNNYRAFFDIFAQAGRRIYLIGGNHEADATMLNLSKRWPFVVDVAYTVAEDHGILVGGIPGYDRDFWPSKKADEDAVVLARDVWRNRDRSKPFIFLTHYPPAGAVDGLSAPTPDAGGSETVRAIIRAIEPDLVVTGHYHQEFGSWGQVGSTWVVNPGPRGHMLRVSRTSKPEIVGWPP